MLRAYFALVLVLLSLIGCAPSTPSTPSTPVVVTVVVTPSPTMGPTAPTPTRRMEVTPTTLPLRCDIRWSEAATHIGQTLCVEGPVITGNYAEKTNGKPTYLNIGLPYPNPKRFQIVIWDKYRSAFAWPPETYYPGKNVCVCSAIKDYKGVTEMEARSSSQIRILQ